MDKSILKSWSKINKLHASMIVECEKIARVANELFDRSTLKNQLATEISCEYHIGEGLVLIIEMLDGEAPHHIMIDAFFNLFIEENLNKIKYRDIISRSF